MNTQQKIGLISDVDPKTARVRVTFPGDDDDEGQDLVSDWLPVLQLTTLGDQSFRIFDVGSQVVCLMDEHCEFGTVLGAIYSEADVAPADHDLGDYSISVAKDGAAVFVGKISRKADGALTAKAKGIIKVETETGDLGLKSGGKLTAEAAADLILKGGPNVQVEGTGTVKVKAGGQFLIESTTPLKITAGGKSLGAILNNLMTQLNALTLPVSGAAAGPPLPVVFGPITADIAAFIQP